MYILVPDATIWSLALPGGLVLLTLLAAAGLPFMALMGQALAVARKRGFYDKAARQLAQPAAPLAALVLLTTGLATGRMSMLQPELQASPLRLPLMAFMALLASSTILLALYGNCWKHFKNAPAAHRFFGLAGGMGMALSGFMALGIARAVFLPGHPLPGTGDMVTLFRALLLPPADSLLWSAFGQSLFAGAACAAGVGLAWISSRRQRDDFGRDYYNFAMAWVARWALIGTLAAMPLLGSTLYQALRFHSPDFSRLPPLVPLAGALLLPLVACALWALVSRSSTPLRHKPTILAALLCVALGAATQLSTLLSAILRG